MAGAGAHGAESGRELRPPAPGSAAALKADLLNLVEAIKPQALQKKPTVYFSVITEMTDEGRKRRTPTALVRKRMRVRDSYRLKGVRACRVRA